MKNQQGITGLQFLMGTTILCLVPFVLGLGIAPEGMQLTFVTFMATIGFMVLKLFFASLWGINLGYFVWTQVLDEQVTTIKSRLSNPENDSYAIVISTLLFVLPGIIAVLAGGNTLQSFLFACFTKGGMGIFAGIILCGAISWIFGVRSLDEFKQWVKTPRNNGYVILIGVSFIVTVAVALAAA